jgi:hypothetical protein
MLGDTIYQQPNEDKSFRAECSVAPPIERNNTPLLVLNLLIKRGLREQAIARFAEDLTHANKSRCRAFSAAEAFVFAQLWSLGYLDSFTSEPASEHAIYESGYAFGYHEGQHPIEESDNDYINK